MLTRTSRKVGALIIIALLVCVCSAAMAGGWGKGPSIGGWHPFDTPVPRKPLDGAKQAINDTKHAMDVNFEGAKKAVGDAATVVWDTAKRPFVETWKFLRDPLAGLRHKADDYVTYAIGEAKKIILLAIKWLSVGLGASVAFGSLVAVAAAALFLRRHGSVRAKKA